jgi:hypothetical protein
MPNGLNRLPSRTRIHGAEDIPGVVTNPARICHTQALFGEGNEGRLQPCTTRSNRPYSAKGKLVRPGLTKSNLDVMHGSRPGRLRSGACCH